MEHPQYQEWARAEWPGKQFIVHSVREDEEVSLTQLMADSARITVKRYGGTAWQRHFCNAVADDLVPAIKWAMYKITGPTLVEVAQHNRPRIRLLFVTTGPALSGGSPSQINFRNTVRIQVLTGYNTHQAGQLQAEVRDPLKVQICWFAAHLLKVYGYNLAKAEATLNQLWGGTTPSTLRATLPEQFGILAVEDSVHSKKIWQDLLRCLTLAETWRPMP